MKMIKVTKKEMEAIERQREVIKNDLSTALRFSKMNNFCERSEPINNMTTEQIVLAWHGHVEIEKEYVSFYEAMRASNEGKKALFNVRNLTYELYPNHEISKTWAAKYSLLDLFNGKFTIEGDNQ